MPESTPVKRGLGPVVSSSLLTPLTIGIPFCVFKFIFGLMALKIGAAEQLAVMSVLGCTVIVWALIDLGMNLVRIVGWFFKVEPPWEFCLVAQVGRLFGSPRFFLTVDTFLSFFIICFFLWSGWIAGLSPVESYFWYAATTVNLISLSIVNIVSEYKLERKDA